MSGLGLVALRDSARLQMVMDKGQELDWFGSRLYYVRLGFVRDPS